MAHCDVCSSTLPKEGEYITCSKCDCNLHLECASITKKTYRSMGETRRASWKCERCRKEEGEKTDAGFNIEKHFEKFRSEILKGQDELKAEIGKSQDFISYKYDEMFKKLSENNDTVVALNKTVNELMKVIKEKDEIINNLSERVVHLEQYTRNCNIELTSVEEKQNENLELLVVNVAKKLDVQLEKNDIEAVHRLPTKRGRIPNIIVQLSSRRKRDEIINNKQKAVIKNKDIINDGNNDVVYVNENLTVFHKNLLWKAREAGRAKGYKFILFKFGRVLARLNESTPVIRITRESDLAKLV